MAGCDVKVEVDRTESGGTFTNHDILKGTVTLTVRTSISLNYIQVKLEGISKTELTIPGRQTGKRDRDLKDKLLQDVHKVLYDTMIVFPPDNIRQVSQAKEFTLTPGNYTYPFEFKLPLNNSCVKVSGISNKIQFNRKTFDVVVNNGNFSVNQMLNKAQSYVQQYANSPQQSSQQPHPQHDKQLYHVTTQLPPSLTGLGEFASVKYFVKVTCKRSSFLKANLRSFDPFTFLPLDLDSHNQPLGKGGDYDEYREVFFRKELVFKDRIPEIVGVKVNNPPVKPLPNPPSRKGLFLGFFGPAQPQTSKPVQVHGISTSTVPFLFEVRFRYPAFLIPTKMPSFKMLIVSNLKPSRYTLAQYGKPEESNGLGIIYLQKLVVELTSITIISVLENDGYVKEIHDAKHEQVIPIMDNSYKNVKFDLMDTKRSKKSMNTNVEAYELAIPASFYENCIFPERLSPSFKTCNIERKYNLTVVAGFSSEKVNYNGSEQLVKQDMQKKIRYVDVTCPDIKVLSGLNMTSSLHSNSKTSLAQSSTSNEAPQLPQRPEAESGQLPTYDDVLRESSYQNDSDHYRARRRYQEF